MVHHSYITEDEIIFYKKANDKSYYNYRKICQLIDLMALDYYSYNFHNPNNFHSIQNVDFEIDDPGVSITEEDGVEYIAYILNYNDFVLNRDKCMLALVDVNKHIRVLIPEDKGGFKYEL